MAAQLRTVRESERFGRQRALLGVTPQRLDDVLDAAVWAAAKRAENLPEIPGTPYRVVLTDPFPDLCALRIYLEIIDADTIELDALECVDEDEDDPVPSS